MASKLLDLLLWSTSESFGWSSVCALISFPSTGSLLPAGARALSTLLVPPERLVPRLCGGLWPLGTRPLCWWDDRNFGSTIRVETVECVGVELRCPGGERNANVFCTFQLVFHEPLGFKCVWHVFHRCGPRQGRVTFKDAADRFFNVQHSYVCTRSSKAVTEPL